MLELNKDLDLHDYTVIVPSICVGNVAQLAVDLLISSKRLERVGTIYHAALIPIYGPAAYQHEPHDTVASCELYQSEAEQLFVVQFRAPFIAKHLKSFHCELGRLIAKAQRVFILSGSFGYEKRTIEDSPFQYKVSSHFKQLYGPDFLKIESKEYYGEKISGSGNAVQLFNDLENHSIPVVLLFRYLLEGDNTTDAKLMLYELNDIFDIGLPHDETNDGGGGADQTNVHLKFNIPSSWKLLFGNNCVETIF